MRRIPLTQGKFALVDDEDFEELSNFKWYAVRYPHVYYAAKKNRVDGKQRTILMHTEIMKTPKGMQTDHRNGNGLDNQRHNLRNCTRAQNQQNSRLCVDSTTGFKGVCCVTTRYKQKIYRYIAARIYVDSRAIHLGLFPNFQSAARAYDVAANKLFGEFAQLNFPMEDIKNGK